VALSAVPYVIGAGVDQLMVGAAALTCSATDVVAVV
jgi:hypothetical protein